MRARAEGGRPNRRRVAGIGVASRGIDARDVASAHAALLLDEGARFARYLACAPTPFRRRDRLWELLRRRDATRPSSEAEAHSIDEYSQDSFVVGDDEISWASSQASSAD